MENFDDVGEERVYDEEDEEPRLYEKDEPRIMILCQQVDASTGRICSAFQAEADALEEGEPYEFHLLADDYGENADMLMWLPDRLRAGFERGGDPLWTDASSPQDAVDSYNNDCMVE